MSILATNVFEFDHAGVIFDTDIKYNLENSDDS